MMMRTAAALLGLVACAAPAAAGICHTENLMPAFLAFRDATATLPPGQRADRFITEFAARHPAYFKSDIFGNDRELRGYALRLLDPAHPEQFAAYPPLTEKRLRAVSARFPHDFAAAEARFAKTFADFRCETPILFGPSFNRFAGSGGTGPDGVYRMRFGIDLIAEIYNPSDLPVLFAHELFHVYHRQVLGKTLEKNFGVVWWGTWIEGLASFVSQSITPGATARQALPFPPDLVARMQAPGVMKRAAARMLRDFDKSGSDYGLWFHTTQSYPDLPPCAGYYMGYRAAATLAARYSLPELARLTPEQVKPLLRAFLEEQAR